MAQGNLMLGLIPSPSSFIGRTAHRKGTGRAEDHIHTDRGHGVCRSECCPPAGWWAEW